MLGRAYKIVRTCRYNVYIYFHFFEEFRRKTGYIHFCQFDIFAIEAAEILRKTVILLSKKKNRVNNSLHLWSE